MPSPSRRDLLIGTTAMAAASMAAPSLAQTAAAPAPAPSLAGKTVLITGTSSGFGRLTALAAARAGARVFATMRGVATPNRERPEAVELIGIARAEDLQMTVTQLDITLDAEVNAAIEAAEWESGGRLDVIVNNAGIGLSGPMELHDQAALAQIFDVNTMGAFRVARAALPAMRAARRGLIINVSSQLGRIVSPSVGAYCGSKFALEAMSEALAYELAPHGVEVTIVQPGGYPTNIWRSGAIGSNAMIERASAEGRAAYAEFIQQSSRRFSGGGGTTDPNDVARAIVEIIALPEGRRPLRRPVHPNTRGTDAINACSTQVQTAALGSGPYAPWHAAVTD